MEEPFSHIVYSKDVLEFVTVANEYCHWVEGCSEYSRKEFVNVSLKLLPLLYLKATVLPKTEMELEDSFIEKVVDENLYQHVLESVRIKLGRFNDYLEVFSPDIQRSDGPLSATVSEDLADMYQDIKNFLESYKSAATEIMNDALYELTENFEVYWGQRLVNTLRALHNIYYGGEDLKEETTDTNEDTKVKNTDDWIISRMQKEWQDDHSTNGD
jgi:hypothetical protein